LIAAEDCGSGLIPPSLGARAYSCRAILEMRRAQLEDGSELRQDAPFPLKDDRRPESERTAAGRYQEPTFLKDNRG
jgi:hypothetical protein